MSSWIDRITSEIGSLTSQLGSFGFTWERIVEAVAVLGVALLLRWLLRRAVHRYFSRDDAGDNVISVGRRTQKAVSAAIWLSAFIALLGLWGVSLSGIWTAVLGIMGVIGVAFLATWAIASNVTAGWMLAPARMFKVGETIEILPEEVSGRVVERTLFFTVVSESDGSITHIPNNFIFQRVVRCKAEYGRPAYDEILARHTPPQG